MNIEDGGMTGNYCSIFTCSKIQRQVTVERSKEGEIGDGVSGE